MVNEKATEWVRNQLKREDNLDFAVKGRNVNKNIIIGIILLLVIISSAISLYLYYNLDNQLIYDSDGAKKANQESLELSNTEATAPQTNKTNFIGESFNQSETTGQQTSSKNNDGKISKTGGSSSGVGFGAISAIQSSSPQQAKKITSGQILSTGMAVAGQQDGILFQDSKGKNIGIFTDSGNFGIGTTGPNYPLTVNGPVVAGPGSVGGPAYMFYPAVTYGATGFFAPAANVIGFVTSGAERARLTSAGDLGVGTRTPGNLIEVQRDQNGASGIVIRNNAAGADSSSQLSFANNRDDQDGIIQLNSDANLKYSGARSFNFISNFAGFGFYNSYLSPAIALRILSDGNVGIGTPSPLSKVHIKGGVDENLRFDVTRGVAYIQSLNDANNAFKFLQLNGNPIALMNGNVGIGTTAPGNKLDVNGAISVLGTNAVAGANRATIDVIPTSGFMRILSLGPNSLTRGGIRLTQTASDGTQHLESVIVVPAGDVGIGVPPKAPLHVENRITTTGDAEVLRLTATTPTVAPYISVGDPGSSYLTGGVINWNPNTNALGLGVHNEPITITIKQGGNVGIGTTNPVSKLAVAGLPIAPPDQSGTAGMLCVTNNGNIWIDNDGTYDCL
ncbi:MAG: hypothetical protein AABX33_04665 [Nanoarchaeota archaeon]